MSTAPDSPLARLRAAYQDRQKAAPAQYVDIWPGGELVARVGRSADLAGARGVMRTALSLATGGAAEGLTATVEDLADVIATATTGLYTRGEDGKLIDMGQDGLPLTFGPQFGTAIGVPEITTSAGAVLVAFTDGEPPELDTVALLGCAMAFAGHLSSGLERPNAETAVGEASALRS